jgi:hypothetical protein
MVHLHRTDCKSTGRQPAGQLALRDVQPQPEPQSDSPLYIPQGEDSFEIVVMVPAGEDTQEAQQLLQNNDHDNEEEEDGNKAEGEDDEDYTPLSNTKKGETSTMPTRSRPTEMKPRC